MNNTSESLFEWDTMEYEHSKKKPDWFWAVGIIGASLGVVAIIFHDLLFGVFILISTVILITLNIKRPEIIKCRISKDGIQIGHVFYPFKKLKSYGIVGADGKKKLALETERFFMPLQLIALNENEVEEIDVLVSNYVPFNDKLEEPSAHIIMDRLGL